MTPTPRTEAIPAAEEAMTVAEAVAAEEVVVETMAEAEAEAMVEAEAVAMAAAAAVMAAEAVAMAVEAAARPRCLSWSTSPPTASPACSA